MEWRSEDDAPHLPPHTVEFFNHVISEVPASALQVMMCSASSRPTITSASKIIMQQGAGLKPFFAGVGPRALSNGLNSAVFFCFFEALRGVCHLPLGPSM